MFEPSACIDPVGSAPGRAVGAGVDGAPEEARSVAEVVLHRFITSLVVDVGALAHTAPRTAVSALKDPAPGPQPAPGAAASGSEAALEDAVPGPALAARLAGVALGELGRERLLDVVDGWERLASWA